MSQFGPEAWKMYNNQLVLMLESAQKQLSDLRLVTLQAHGQTPSVYYNVPAVPTLIRSVSADF